jgi:hypothetical protein
MKISFSLFFFFFFLVVKGFELRALWLPVGSQVYASADLNCDPPILPSNWDDRHTPSCPQTFCPGWPGTAILPISTSQVAGIIGMSHCTQLADENF